MIPRLSICGLIVIHSAVNFAVSSTSHKVTIVAHMVNTPTSIRWALTQGANGIELDLKFNGVNPGIFHHGIFCDCSCFLRLFTNKENICRALDEGCSGFTSAADMVSFLGSKEILSSNLALIYIDAKLDTSVIDYVEAGANLVRLFNTNVMAQGFRGQILVGCPNFKFFTFLQGAFREANKNLHYADRYFYTIDQIGANSISVWEYLKQLDTNNIVYSSGITSCFFIDRFFYRAIDYCLHSNIYSAVGVWTPDTDRSMNIYLKLGVDFIVTNRPKLGVEMVSRFLQYRMAKPGQALTIRSSSRIFTARRVLL